MGWGHSSTLSSGQTVPPFQLKTLDGITVPSSEILAKGPALFAFYKSSCPVCQLTLPFLNRLQGGAVQVFAVSQDSPATAREFNDAFDLTLPSLVDPSADDYPASNLFGLTHVPSLFLLEPDGRITMASVGFYKKDLESLADRAGLPIFHAGEKVPEAKSG
jgi:peroxiredoxin